MSVSSMTGFARVSGVSGLCRWSWEIRTVNSKALDIRFRLPPGHDGLEGPARQAVAAAFSRGACQIGLQIQRDNAAGLPRVNVAALEAILAATASLRAKFDIAAPRLDGLLALRGVLDGDDAVESDEERRVLATELLAGLDRALTACRAMRREEGEALVRVLEARLAEISAHVAAAEANPARQPAAIRARLSDQVRQLLDSAPLLDQDRLHQEAVLLASRADIREELDRLTAHDAAARRLLREGGAIGRRLDFLAQEFNREVNTLCAKSNDSALTATGLTLKSIVEQFREQVQNIE